MVIGSVAWSVSIQVLAQEAAQETGESVFRQLDPPQRVAVVMTLLGLVLLGIVMIACVMISARWMRRLTNRDQRSSSRLPASGNRNWRQLLQAKLKLKPPQDGAGETIISQPGSEETHVD